jgi:hypothetical protein
MARHPDEGEDPGSLRGPDEIGDPRLRDQRVLEVDDGEVEAGSRA